MEIEVTQSMAKVLQHENIAIVALALMCVFEGILVAFLLNHIFKIKDILEKVALAINTLNERLNNHD